MKLILNRSITTKLFLVNSLIFLIMGGILFVVNASFEHIQTSLSKAINEDVNQVMLDARVGRELNRVFSEINTLIRTIYEYETDSSQADNALRARLNDLTQQERDEQLQRALQKLSSELQRLLDEKARVRLGLQTLAKLDADLKMLLEELDALLQDKVILSRIESDAPQGYFNYLANAIPELRELLLMFRMEVNKLQQVSDQPIQQSSSDRETSAPRQNDAMHELFRTFEGKLKLFPQSDPEFKAHIPRFSPLLAQYEEQIVSFYSVRNALKIQVDNMNALQESILGIMRVNADRVAQTTENIQAHIAKVIGDSKGIIFTLTVVIFLVLGLGWVFTHVMTRPLLELSTAAKQLADGDLNCNIRQLTSRDEIGKLSTAFTQLLKYFQEMAQIATEISYGHLDLDVHPRAEHDVFGTRFRQMIAYLQSIGKTAAYIAEGDLRHQNALKSDIDQLGNAFLHMQNALIALITEIRAGADHISTISAQVLDTSTKNTEALTHIGNAADVTSTAMREMSASAEEVRISTENLRSSVDDTSSSINEMIGSVKHVAENSRKLSTLATNTSQTIFSIVASLQTVASQAEHSETVAEKTRDDATAGQRAIEQMRGKMTAISDVTGEISEIISRLGTRSTDIGTILDVINEVADQTSLLALNASIIAAQAGEQGRGFAVVAQEIKELATRVGTSTKEIAKIITGVQRDSSDAAKAIQRGQEEVRGGVVAAQEAATALDEIAASAGNSSQVAGEIAVLVRQQTTASTNVADSMKDVANMSTEITLATQEQEKNSAQLLHTVENMQDLALQVLRAMQEQQQNTQHVTEFMEDVLELVDQNIPTVKQLADTADALTVQAHNLNHQVERFTLPGTIR